LSWYKGREMDDTGSNEQPGSEQTWTDKLKPANPIGFVISSVVSIAAILVFFFAIPCPDNPA